MPEMPINVVVRADSSGTSFVFSKHLSAISPEFDRTVWHQQENTLRQSQLPARRHWRLRRHAF
jgi:ABC-type phosphate transport system substrate-binding protein